MAAIDLENLLDAADQYVADELERMPEVVLKGRDLVVKELPYDERVWHRVDDAVAVVADLKSSTQLGLNTNARSTASIYEAATGNVAKIFDEFGADFVAIQGDGGFGLFWGDHRNRRAVCAAITIQTFGKNSLVERLTKKWDDKLPETGLKVGVASSPLLAKRVGLPGEDRSEPVWAGRAVNYAAKCAQQADRNQMIVTGSMWDWILHRDHLAASCDCGVPSTDIWDSITIDKIPDTGVGVGEREGKLLTSVWCKVHGEEYCNAVMGGKRSRPNVTSKVAEALSLEYKSATRLAARKFRESSEVQLAVAKANKSRLRDQNALRSGLRGSGR